MRKQMLAIVLVLMLGLCGCSDSQTTQTKEPTEETTGITETRRLKARKAFYLRKVSRKILPKLQRLRKTLKALHRRQSQRKPIRRP